MVQEVPVLISVSSFSVLLCVFVQLHERFERVKRMHQEEKTTLEEKRRELEEEMNSFNRRKMAAETLQALSLHTSKDKKRYVLKHCTLPPHVCVFILIYLLLH